MAKAKLGVLIGEEGVTSVVILGGDAEGREEVLGLYSAIRVEIDAFDRSVRQRASSLSAKRSPEVAHS